ncbi:hypothetical protein HZS_6148, partial [Henneguya salminicola]
HLIFLSNGDNPAITTLGGITPKLLSPELSSIQQINENISEDNLTEIEIHLINQFIIQRLNVSYMPKCNEISTETITSLSEQIINAIGNDNISIIYIYIKSALQDKLAPIKKYLASQAEPSGNLLRKY